MKPVQCSVRSKTTINLCDYSSEQAKTTTTTTKMLTLNTVKHCVHDIYRLIGEKRFRKRGYQGRSVIQQSSFYFEAQTLLPLAIWYVFLRRSSGIFVVLQSSFCFERNLYLLWQSSDVFLRLSSGRSVVPQSSDCILCVWVCVTTAKTMKTW